MRISEPAAQAKHAATPLYVLALYGNKEVAFCISDQKNWAKKAQQICLPRTPENIEFVEKAVRACNAHDDLVKVLNFILRGIEGGHIKFASYIDFDPEATQIEFQHPSDMIRAALAKSTATE